MEDLKYMAAQIFENEELATRFTERLETYKNEFKSLCNIKITVKTTNEDGEEESTNKLFDDVCCVLEYLTDEIASEDVIIYCKSHSTKLNITGEDNDAGKYYFTLNNKYDVEGLISLIAKLNIICDLKDVNKSVEINVLTKEEMQE